MTESQEQLLAAARSHVTEIFTRQVKPELVFHNLEHTEDVVEACSYMADFYKLEDEDRLVLLLSAWFHDTGYANGEAVGHEERSVQTAKEFLDSQPDVDEEIIQKISSNIRATKMPQSPLTQLEKILCDADLYHLAADDYKARNQLLRQEQMYLLNTKISKKDWRRNNITFLEAHKYFTEYGDQKLEPKKQRNLVALNKLSKADKTKGGKEEEEQEDEKQTGTDEAIFPYISQPDQFDLLDEKTKQKNTERGIQTMFRTTSNNHFELSALADGKANIMISVNAIIISVVLTVLLVRLPFYPQYIVPTIILMVVCLSAMIFAILATRPSVSSGRFSEDDIRKKQANLLFFGNFHRMKLEEYEWGMNEMLKDREYLYNSMIKDIYFLGVVLARKYRLLRVAYTIFMWGLIATVIAFAAASLAGDFIVTNNPTVIDY